MLFRTSSKLFIHVDCDSFYASCEMLRNPKLKGKKVCVGGDMIIACSYPAKKMGIKTGTPIWEAKKILGNTGYYFLPDHRYYAKISEKIMNYLENNSAGIEPFSIDEAFCDITGIPEYYKMSTREYVRKMQKEILRNIGIPVSIGVSNTRIKAKIYSKINKPYGIYIGDSLEPQIALFKKLPIKDIPYIGKAYQERFKYSCTTIYDYIQLGYWKIKKEIGKNGTDLRLELCGVNAFIVKKSQIEKSIGRSRSFNKTKTNNREFLIQQLIQHFDRVYDDISQKNFEVKTITVMLRTESFQTFQLQYKLPEYTNIRKNLLTYTILLFEQIYSSDTKYRSTGVIFGEFRNYLPKQMGIFEPILRSKECKHKLTKVIENINSKYDTKKISYGFSLLGKKDDVKLGIRK